MARNQLPEGVGKKIVEALKRQAEADITPIPSSAIDNTISSTVNTEEVQQNTQDDILNEFEQPSQEINNNISNVNLSSMFDVKKMKDDYNQASEKSYNNTTMQDNLYSQPQKEALNEAPYFKAGSETTTITFNQTPSTSGMVSSFSGIPFNEEPIKSVMPATVSISIPTNVAVLKNLIASLPTGVNKQMGAQIIRQTLEAMGLPMAGVLKEAQEVQEELNTNTRECMLQIQELKTKIMQLEQSVQEYQRNITQINDLVSLFLLTDRNR